MEGNPKAKGKGGQEKSLDIKLYVGSHQRESVCALVPGTKPISPATPRLHNQRNSEVRQEKEDGGVSRSDREATGIAPPPHPQGSLAPDEWGVQGFGQPRAAACLGYHGGAI